MPRRLLYRRLIIITRFFYRMRIFLFLFFFFTFFFSSRRCCRTRRYKLFQPFKISSYFFYFSCSVTSHDQLLFFFELFLNNPFFFSLSSLARPSPSLRCGPVFIFGHLAISP